MRSIELTRKSVIAYPEGAWDLEIIEVQAKCAKVRQGQECPDFVQKSLEKKFSEMNSSIFILSSWTLLDIESWKSSLITVPDRHS